MGNPVIDIVTRMKDEASAKIRPLLKNIESIRTETEETVKANTRWAKSFDDGFSQAITKTKTFGKNIQSTFDRIQDTTNATTNNIRTQYKKAFAVADSVAEKSAQSIIDAETRVAAIEAKFNKEREQRARDLGNLKVKISEDTTKKVRAVTLKGAKDIAKIIREREKLYLQQSKLYIQIINKAEKESVNSLKAVYAEKVEIEQKEIALLKSFVAEEDVIKKESIAREIAMERKLSKQIAAELRKKATMKSDISALELDNLDTQLDIINKSVKRGQREITSIHVKGINDRASLRKKEAREIKDNEKRHTRRVAANQRKIVALNKKGADDRLKIQLTTVEKIKSLMKGTIAVAEKVANEASTSMKRAAKNTENSWEQAMERVGQSMQQAGRSILVLGAAITSAFVIPIAKAYEVEKAMGVVNAITRATQQEYILLTNAARELGKATVFTAGQAAGGMQDLARAGFEVTEIIGAMPNVLNLAAAAQLSIAEAAKISANIMRGYGLTIKDLSNVNDVLVTGFTEATTDLQSLGVAFRYAGPLAKTAGLELKETAGILSAFANAGFSGSIAGTSLRNALTRLTGPTKAAQTILDGLGVTVTDDAGDMLSFTNIVGQFEVALGDIAGEAERTAVLFEVFGQRAGPAMGALISQGSDKLQEMMDKFTDIQGVTDEIATKQLDTLYGGFVKLTSAVSTLLITIGAPFLNILKKISLLLRSGVNWLTKMTEKYPTLTKAVFSFIGVLGFAVTALGGLMFTIGALIVAYGKLGFVMGEFITKSFAVGTAADSMSAALARATIATNSLSFAFYKARFALIPFLITLAPIIVAVAAVVLAFAAVTVVLRRLGKVVDIHGISKLTKLKGFFIDIASVIGSFVRVLKDKLIPSFGDLDEATAKGEKNRKGYIATLKETIKQEENYARVVATHYLPMARERLKSDLKEVKSLEDLEEVRASSLEQFDYHTTQYIKDLKKRSVSAKAIVRLEKKYAEERAAFEEVAENRIRDIRLETKKATIWLYNHMLQELKVGSDTWVTIEKANLNRIKSAATETAAFREKLIKRGVLSQKTAADLSIIEQERIYNKERAILEEQLLNIDLLSSAKLEEMQAMYKRLERLDLEYIEKKRVIEQNRIEGVIAENMKEFNKWKALEESRISVVEAVGKTELLSLNERNKNKITGVVNYLKREVELVRNAQEDRFDIVDRNIERELQANRARIQIFENDEKALLDRVAALREVMEREFINRVMRVEYGKRIAGLELMLEEMQSKREAAAAQEETLVNKREKLYEKLIQSRLQGEKKIADAMVGQQRKATALVESLIGKRAATAKKEVEDNLELLEEAHSEGLISEEDYNAAREKLQKQASDAIKKAYKEEGDAVEELSETRQTDFQAIAEGILLYEELSKEAKVMGGVAGELADTFNRFSSNIHLGSLEAEALKASMSGNAEEMLKAADALEMYAEQAGAFSEGTDRITRGHEAAAAATVLRAEASRKLAMADREAALSMERLTAATQEYLGIASSARSAISQFAGLIEDLQFALENNLLTQGQYNDAVDELKSKLAAAVPEGTDLNNMISNLLASLNSGTITVDFFTAALSEMTKAGFDAASGMDGLSDSLAGHSVTTSADAASKSIGGLTGRMQQGITTTKSLLNGMQAISSEMLTSFANGDIFDKLGTQYNNLNSALQTTFDNTTRVFEDNIDKIKQLTSIGSKLSVEVDVAGLNVLNNAIDSKLNSLKQLKTEIPELSSDINIQRNFTFELKSDITTYDGEAADTWLNKTVFPKMLDWLEMRGTTV